MRYVNPGYTELLDGSGAVSSSNSSYNPSNGVSFSGSNSLLKILPAGIFTGDIFCKFDIYYPNSASSAFYMGLLRKNALTNQSNTAGIRINSSGVCLYSISSAISSFISLKPNSLNTILFRIQVTDSSNATAELIVNQGTKITATFNPSNYYNENSPFAVYFPNLSYNYYVSNLIISDVEISPREKIISLPISSTQSDMTAGNDNIYIANAADQILLQTPDVADLITAYDANSSITGIALIGNPAYKTGTAITTLTALSKVSNVITEHGTCNLSDDTLAAITDGWSLSNTKLSDLQNIQFGWKAGA